MQLLRIVLDKKAITRRVSNNLLIIPCLLLDKFFRILIQALTNIPNEYGRIGISV